MAWAMLILIAVLGGCFNVGVDKPVMEKPLRVGFWVENNRSFIELPPSMYRFRSKGSNIIVEAKGCLSYQGKSSSVIALQPESEFWLAALIWAESRGEILAGQAAVGQVVLNRVKDPRFNNSIVGVIFESTKSASGKTIWQFSCVLDNQIFQAWQALDFNNYLVLAKSLLAGTMLDKNLNTALGFFNPVKVQATDPNKNNWVWKQPVLKQIGNHVFFTIP